MPSLLVLSAIVCGCAAHRFPWPLRAAPTPPAVMQGHAEVSTVQPGHYHRMESRILVRRVKRATRANLDYAAYWANAILRQEAPADSVVPGEARIVSAHALFGAAVPIDTIVASLAATPLTAAERARPLAFEPLVDAVARHNAVKAGALADARAAIRGESWGLKKRPGSYFQQITTLYIHRMKGGQARAWVKIEFEPWAKLFTAMPDEDRDGYPEIYAQLQPGALPAEIVAYIDKEYAGRLLSTAEVHRWANELASYWYPSFNTDVVELGPDGQWPLPTTEADVGAWPVISPTVVIRGKPQGKVLYNVLAIAGVAPLATNKKPRAGERKAERLRWSAQLKATPVASMAKASAKALEAEAALHHGFDRWLRQTRRFRRALRKMLRRRPKALKALIGKDAFLFYRRSLDYLVGGAIQDQAPAKNPFAAIVEFKDYLAARGIDFLLVPVPTKAEVFPDKLPGITVTPKDPLPLLNPHGRKFLLDLARAGVEVIDLLPRYLAARKAQSETKTPGQSLYQAQDTHWTDRGLRLAAKVIARRLQRYRWYPLLAKRPLMLTTKRLTFKRHGDLHSRLTPREQRRFKPATLVGQQVVLPSGKLYDDDQSSPIVILGDSFTGVYQRTYCGSAGISAHLAREIRFPVDLVMSYGGGPSVRKKLLTRGDAAIKRMRLLIWLFAARDFYDYWDDWALIKPAARPKAKNKKGAERK